MPQIFWGRNLSGFVQVEEILLVAVHMYVHTVLLGSHCNTLYDRETRKNKTIFLYMEIKIKFHVLTISVPRINNFLKNMGALEWGD